VRNGRAYLRDGHAADLRLPGWLRDAAGAVGTMNSHEATDCTHPEDRDALVAAFLQSVASPGVLCQVHLRMRLDGEWSHRELIWLNQLDNPDLRGILCVERSVTGPAIVDPGHGDEGEHDSTGWMLLELDDAGIIVGARGGVTDLLGYEPDELCGKPPTRFVHHDAIGDSVALWISLRATTGATASSRRRWVRKDGTEVWLESSYLHLGPEDGSKVLSVVWDITQRLAGERELEASRAQHERLAAEHEALATEFRMLADQVPAVVFRCTLHGDVLFHNARWNELLPSGSTGSRLHDVVHPDDHRRLDDALQEVGVHGNEVGDFEVLDRDGRRAWRLSLRSLRAGGAEHRGIVGSMEDVTATVSLRQRAELDPLTGLLNRASLEDRLALLVPGGDDTCVLFIDLDSFKTVNDEHGHDVGDAVLIEVGRRLREAVRPQDAVARFGGDEFVIVCPALPDEATEPLVQRIEQRLAAPVSFDGGQWHPRGSVGAARPRTGESVADVLRRADLAMFDAKRTRHRTASR
jgi:diguanylate cyclase (GGDEF)-like protein/PAS domain S-box-containing protein